MCNFFKQFIRGRVRSRIFTEEKPIFGFFSFLCGDLQFMDKISFTLRTLSFPDVCTNGGFRFKKLAGKNKPFLFFQKLTVYYHFQSKFERNIYYYISFSIKTTAKFSHYHITTLPHYHIITSSHHHIITSSHHHISTLAHQHIGTSAHWHII